MATEREYNDIIAPMLLAVVDRCKSLGMSIIARVEWAPEEAGITQSGIDTADIAQKLTHIAAHSRGNFDAMAMHCLKHFDCSQSAILARLRPTTDSPV